jgi:23S rRNA pseudouridine1911/1915/1917 synthase
METFTVPAEDRGERLDRWLARMVRRSRAEVKRFIQSGQARVNGEEAKPNYLLRPDDRVVIEFPPPELPIPQPELLTIHVLYEDEQLIVVDKPPGMVTHPAPGHPGGTLVNGLLHRCRLAETGDPQRPGIVHRLDGETSGVLVAVKTEAAYQGLTEQFKQGEVGKSYLALVHGVVEEDEGRIELPLGRGSVRRKEVQVRAEGREAITEFSVLQRFQDKTLLEVRPNTGRMHQIRVHLSHIGHPVVGDPKYGRRKDGAARMMLHARELSFWHPATGKRVRFTAPLPEEFTPWLDHGAGADNRSPPDRR